MNTEILSENIAKSGAQAVRELIEASSLSKGDILVIGCSSSEIMGGKIGKDSTYFAAEALLDAIYPILNESGIYLAAQCCEHLNRALVIEKECAEKYFLDRVAVIPQPKAGGSFATAAYKKMNAPVLVEHIRAHAGIDVGGTLIGMHLRDVAVPVRLSVSKIGEASIICAYTRPKFIGGERAVYK
ncbi:MAG: TIGR01440 family protein [Ruminococcaceae bacterium]|nr:TIGR01440 family protein [Oscillospiraceae bacterium]